MGSTAQADLADRVKSWAGLALAAFLAAINLIGLNNGEIPNILRNNIVAADVTGLLILAAAMTAVFGALLPPKKYLPVLWLVPISLAAAGAALLPEVYIQLPTQGNYSLAFAFSSGGLGIAALVALGAVTYWYYGDHAAWVLLALPVTLILGVLACVIAGFNHKNHVAPGLNDYLIWAIVFGAGCALSVVVATFWQSSCKPTEGRLNPDGRSVLLVLALVLTAVATVAGLRAETRSQDLSTAPKLDSSLTLSSTGPGGVYSLTVTASAAHLPGTNVVEVTVYGFPSGKPPAGGATANAKDPPSPSYAQESWRHPRQCQIPGCRMISNSFYGPDSQGSLNSGTDVLFLRKSYDRIQIIARRFSPGAPCQNGSESQCYTVISLVVPPVVSSSPAPKAAPSSR